MATNSHGRMMGIGIFSVALFLNVNQALPYDMYNITKPDVEFAVPTSITANIRLGEGVNLNDPTFPILAPNSPFLPASTSRTIALATDNPIPVDSIATSATSFIEDTSDYEFSQTLSANFSAAFGFASGNAAYNYAKRISQTSDQIIALITLSTTAPQLASGLIRWKPSPSSESDKIKSDPDRLRQFIEDYGSHYILSIKYGYRVAVYGKLDTKSETEVESFHAAFKAAFSGGSAGGGLTASQIQTLSSSHVELAAEVAAGKIDPQQSIVLRGFSEIYPFLDKIKNGEIRLYPGPIEVSAKSYWHTLIDFPKTRSLLAENTGQPAAAPYGVPAGTVIAWSPPSSSLGHAPDGSIQIFPPNGWAICDGANGTPNLTDSFVMGTREAKDVLTTGGSATHVHTGTTDPNVQNEYFSEGGLPLPFNLHPHTHKFKTDPASNIPPYVKLVFIMKE